MKHFLETLGSLWSAGLPINWKLLDDGRRCKVALPGVPFERKRHWIDLLSCPSASLPNLIDNKSGLLAYVPSWRQSRRAPIAAAGSLEWIFFVREGQEDLAACLEAGGHHVIRVYPGSSFQRVSNLSYRVRPGMLEDFQEVLTRHPARRLVHLWSFSERDPRDAMGFHALRTLIQALALQPDILERELSVLTGGVFDITGEEQLNPASSLVSGICKVAPKEVTGLRCRMIDLYNTPVEAQVDELLSSVDVPEVALRGRGRWTLGYEPVSPRDSTTNAGALIQEGAVIWITGGTGGIGLAIAQWLAERYRCRLILTQRSELPARNEWDVIADAQPGSRLGKLLRSLLNLERAAGGLLVLAADVCDAHAMRSAARFARQQFGQINGAIHAAGIAGGGVISLMTREMADAVMAPKVAGTMILADVLAEDPLDFLVLCSSIASVTGDFGQSDYCAANCFLDAFAHARTSRGAFTQSINWGPWREAGMAVDTNVPDQWRRVRAALLHDGIGTREGVEALDAAIAGKQTQVILLPSDLEGWRASAEAMVAGLIEQTATEVKPPQIHIANSDTYVAPETEVQKTLVAMWEHVLSIRGIGLDDDFFALGGNSLLALQMLPQLRAAFGTRVGSAHVFQYSTARRLAEYIETETVSVGAEAFERGARMREKRASRGAAR